MQVRGLHHSSAHTHEPPPATATTSLNGTNHNAHTAYAAHTTQHPQPLPSTTPASPTPPTPPTPPIRPSHCPTDSPTTFSLSLSPPPPSFPLAFCLLPNRTILLQLYHPLQSSDPTIFAGGDIVRLPSPRPKVQCLAMSSINLTHTLRSLSTNAVPAVPCRVVCIQLPGASC